MSSFNRIIAILFLIAVNIPSCTTTKEIITEPARDGGREQIEQEELEEEQEEREYNFKFTGYDINIDDPDNDRRSYYVISIDKVEVGRTTIGLESQEKTFECNLPANRHLLIVEKWALDRRKGKYVMLNNIEQPKPSYTYFNIPEDGYVAITLENDPVTREALYNIEVEE